MREYTVILRVRCDMSIDVLRKLIMWETSTIDEVVGVEVQESMPTFTEEEAILPQAKE